MDDVMVFVPVYRLEPETVSAVFDLEWEGPMTFVFQEDNPHAGTCRETGIKNHLHQYQRGRELFLRGNYEAMLVIESDIIPPRDALMKLAAVDADLAYGVYVFRVTQVVNVFEAYPRPSRNPGESLSVRGLWPRLRNRVIDCSGGGLGCVLIKRHVLEEQGFRLNDNGAAFCDSPFTVDCWRAGYEMKADTSVICGHIREDGEVLWPS
jgi:hypothetical protein